MFFLEYLKEKFIYRDYALDEFIHRRVQGPLLAPIPRDGSRGNTVAHPWGMMPLSEYRPMTRKTRSSTKSVSKRNSSRKSASRKRVVRKTARKTIARKTSTFGKALAKFTRKSAKRTTAFRAKAKTKASFKSKFKANKKTFKAAKPFRTFAAAKTPAARRSIRRAA